MTTPPDWAIKVPGVEGIHSSPPSTRQWENLTQDQIAALRRNLINSIMQIFVVTAKGVLIPGGLENTLQQIGDIFNPVRGLLELVSGFELGSGFPELSDVIDGWREVLRGDSPLPAWNLFGNPRPGLFNQLSLSSIGDFSPNLLVQPLFSWSGAVDDPDGVWIVDTDRYHVDPDNPETQQGNSVRVLADGVTHDELLSDPALPVTPGQRVEMTIYTLWVDLVATGEPIRLSVIGYGTEDGTGVEVLDTVIASAGSGLPAWSVDHPDADDEGWVALTATFVVPESPAVRSIRMSPQVTEGATAGAVWFSDAAQRKTQPLEERFIGGLAEKLVGFDLDGFFDSSRLAGLIEQSRIAGLVNRLSGLDIDGNLDTAFLSGLIEQSRIAGLVNRLSGLDVDGFFDSSRLAGELDQSQLNIPNVQDLVDRIVEGGGGSGVGNLVDDVRDRIGGIFDVANRADQNVIDIQASVQQLVDENSSGTTGNRNSVTFSGADGSPLTGFSVGPNFNDIVIRLDANGNAVAGLRADAPDGRYWAVFDDTQYASTDQSVSGVLGRNGSPQTSLTLFCRADPAATTGVYVNAQTDRIEVGYFTRSGTAFTFNQFVSTNRTTNIGARVELRSVGTTYRVLVNGVQVLGVTTPAGSSLINPANNCSGFVLSRVTTGLIFTTVHHSFWLASFAMADYAPGGSTVAGWNLTRSNTAGVSATIVNGSVTQVPAGFFTLQDSATEVEVTNLGQGIVKILKAGRYEMRAGIVAYDNNPAGRYAAPWVLFRNGTQATGPISTGGSVKVFLNVNDTVQPGVAALGTLPTTANDISITASSGDVGVVASINSLEGFADFSGHLVATN